MAASADMIKSLRRMVGEPESTTYSDADLAACIERYPLIDYRGESPLVQLYSVPPAPMDPNPYWMPTYDLNAAAADIWAEKAAVLAQDFDFSADGAQYSRSQAYQQAMAQSRYYRGRRSPKTMTQRPEPRVFGLEASNDEIIIVE
jgi:hypothetical protein